MSPPGSPDNPVEIYNGHPGLQLDGKEIQNLFLSLSKLPIQPQPAGELSIAFLTPEEHTQLHITHHNNPDPTDVITFQGDPAHNHAGEICVSPAFAQEYSEGHNSPFHRELTLYLVHGWLHLCGLDDLNETDRQAMRKGEKEALAHLEAHNAIPNFQLAKR